MKNEFVTYEQALALKELGFDEKCLAYWFNETPLNPEGQCLVYYRKPYDNVGITNGIIREYGWAPLYQQAFRWFRELGFDSSIYRARTKTKIYCWSISNLLSGLEYPPSMIGERADSYEEAELACLKKLIEIVKEKNNE
jgi:hypothetical protein